MSTPIEIDCSALKLLLESRADFAFIDCREPEEHETARIAGATLLPMSEIQDRVDELSGHKDKRVVIHCHHGGRSLRVARWLRQQGFLHAQSVAGGIDQWAIEIDPTVPRY